MCLRHCSGREGWLAAGPGEDAVRDPAGGGSDGPYHARAGAVTGPVEGDRERSHSCGGRARGLVRPRIQRVLGCECAARNLAPVPRHHRGKRAHPDTPRRDLRHAQHVPYWRARGLSAPGDRARPDDHDHEFRSGHADSRTRRGNGWAARAQSARIRLSDRWRPDPDRHQHLLRCQWLGETLERGSASAAREVAAGCGRQRHG
jgi:hypothetical protein